MQLEITFSETTRTYATEANLRKGLTKLGLDAVEGLRFMIVRTPEGRWTAIFLIGDYLRKNGGYAGLAAQHGFISI